MLDGGEIVRTDRSVGELPDRLQITEKTLVVEILFVEFDRETDIFAEREIRPRGDLVATGFFEG